MDLGFGSMVSRAILMHVTADQGRCRAILQHADGLSHIIHSLDSRADKQKFLEQNHGAFMIPKRLEFQGPKNEEAIEPEIQKVLHLEMEQRLKLLDDRIHNLRIESDEIWKTLEAAEINLLDHLNSKDYDTSSLFGDGTHSQHKPIALITNKSKAEKHEMEEFYILKIREYMLGTSRIARLDAKAELLRNILTNDATIISTPITKSILSKRKRIGRMNMSGQPKLFGGSLEEYLESTGEEIPLIMRSCIRVINHYGLHHQGIFRVSGSQAEISNFREGFEKGEDPLADTTDASDINSVAGVLKLYLRELREPLFPIIYFDHFVSLAQLESKQDVIWGIKKFLQSLPRSVVVVIRYLFAFLNHLSEYSDENMMDAYNLAICFGPTLMPAPEDKDQVQYQNQVNELIKNMIVYHEELFPKDFGGLQYEKYISEEPFIDIEIGDSPTEQLAGESEVYPSEDESDLIEATVQFDFNARSSRELTLRKGEHVILRKQVSNDWWQGTVNGREGLVPDKYVSLKIKEEEREKVADNIKSKELPRMKESSGSITETNQIPFFLQQERFPPSGHSISCEPSKVDSEKYQVCGEKPTDSLLEMSVQERSSDRIFSIAIEKNDSDLDHDENNRNIEQQYTYHNEPHSFEKSMDIFEDLNDLQLEEQNPSSSEPIYAEPNKPHSKINFGLERRQPSELKVCRASNETSTNSHEIDKLQSIEQQTAQHFYTRNSRDIAKDEDSKQSQNEAFFGSIQSAPDEKVLNKSFHNVQKEIYENQISSSTNGENRNIFQKKKELWEKRVELNSHNNFNQTRILERKRIAPDLVMDLPFLSQESTLRASRDSIEMENISQEEVSSFAESFSLQNQCTLKKNERSSSLETVLHNTSVETSKPEMKNNLETIRDKKLQIDTSRRLEKSFVLEEILHIEEENGKEHLEPAINLKKNLAQSPIPKRNTQKYVSKFADLKLTGGCLGQADNATTPISLVSTLNESSRQFLSFKPQVKVKPHILKKPLLRSAIPSDIEQRDESNSENE